MAHSLPMPLWQNTDERRTKSALSAEMTPLSLDAEAGNASFAGSSEIYWTDLHKCTCMDFHINQNRSAPCKHMIRLSMELDLLPSEGKKDDVEAAQYRLALHKTKELVAAPDLLAAVKAGAFLKDLFVHGTATVPDTVGMETSPLRFFFVISGNTAKPIKTRKKDAVSLIKAVEARLGEWLLDTPAALLSAFEGYEQTSED